MIVKIKLLTDTAKLPTRHRGTGFDVYADESCVLRTGDVRIVKTGIASEFKTGIILLGERSGMALKNIDVKAGWIDPDYRGEWGVLLRNMGPDYEITRGDRICQALPLDPGTVYLEHVAELSETERGDGGFGSTGK